jgi:YidC/Oxa1 family membrane protein insertase
MGHARTTSPSENGRGIGRFLITSTLASARGPITVEKRFVLFIVLTMLIVVGYNALVATFNPPPPAPIKKAAEKGVAEKKEVAEEKPAPPEAAPQDRAEVTAPPPAAAEAVAPSVTHPHRVLTLGSYAPDSGSPLLVTFNSRGAALERVELVGRTASGELRYRDLDDTAGYLGNLALAPDGSGGCRVQVVPRGTPAALAVPSDPAESAGLQPGDLLVSLGGMAVSSARDAEAALSRWRPGQPVKLSVERTVAGQSKSLTFTATLGVRPFELLRPEPLETGELQPHPASMLLTVRDASRDLVRFGSALHDVDWQATELADGAPGVEFRYVVDSRQAGQLELGGPVEVVKRYRLAKSGGQLADVTAPSSLPYHLHFEIEIRNLGSQPRKIAYRLDGTNGLPTEGWWYLAKIHPRMFYSAGARDILLHTVQGGHRLIGCPAIVSGARKEGRSAATPLFGESEPSAARTLTYIGVDTQYFAAALLPVSGGPDERPAFARAEALALGDLAMKPKGWERTVNVSYQLYSDAINVEPDSPYRQEFVLFVGPKEPGLLAQYGLSDWIYYGWFGAVSKLLSAILHFFHDTLVGNYAIAIVMLTVLVRGCMFPLSRKAAKNAAMMQELAPEMKKIAEKYKNNMEARGKAQQELFRRHNYNPFSGCWMMFLQLPVFIGLYRCLAVDIRLRQAPLISMLDWSSNLAGPDKLFYWKGGFLTFLTDESGWLGPYFNVLPIFTIALFLVHQKLFTPPATDEQTALQLKMMKIMTIFMGVLFYKVPAGLCIYFIASSVWGIAERKLLPKPKASTSEPPVGPKPVAPPREPGKKPFAFLREAFKTGGNGSSPPPRKKPGKRPKRK